LSADRRVNQSGGRQEQQQEQKMNPDRAKADAPIASRLRDSGSENRAGLDCGVRCTPSAKRLRIG
jgi:hypothetical protein